MDKLTAVMLFIILLAVACYHLIRRRSIAKFYKARFFFNLGTEKFWERYILVFSLFSIIIILFSIISILFQ
jgi:hypothetical protein